MSSMAVNICSGCGSELLEGHSSCPRCSQRLDAVAKTEQSSSIVGESSSIVVESSSSAAEYVCAPVWRRFIAATFDVALAMAILCPFAIVLMWVMEAYHSQIGLSESKSRALMGSAMALLWIVWFWIYCAVAESSVYQATPGKLLLRLKVGNAQGERISFYQATCRYFAKFLSTFALLAGFAMAAFHSRKLSLHDMVAGTMVIRPK